MELKCESQGIVVEAAITFTEDPDQQISLLNNQRTIFHNCLNKAFIAGVAKAINITTGSLRTPLIWHKLIREHTYAAIRITVNNDLELSGQRLESKLHPIVKKLVSSAMTKLLKSKKKK